MPPGGAGVLEPTPIGAGTMADIIAALLRTKSWRAPTKSRSLGERQARVGAWRPEGRAAASAGTPSQSACLVPYFAEWGVSARRRRWCVGVFLPIYVIVCGRRWMVLSSGKPTGNPVRSSGGNRALRAVTHGGGRGGNRCNPRRRTRVGSERADGSFDLEHLRRDPHPDALREEDWRVGVDPWCRTRWNRLRGIAP